MSHSPIQSLEYNTEEKKRITREYRHLLKLLDGKIKEVDKIILRKALDVALEAHKGVRRKSGEAYIFHPIAVARICVEEMGLGSTSAVAAFLHDVVEDTDVTLEDIENMFGKKIAKIIDGLTKISEIFDKSEESTSIQAENFRKILLTLTDDVRVILIKIADRLHNMRTLGAMKEYKRRKIASETMYLYAPMAHRLGLYNIKSELEDLAFKNLEPEIYREIESKLKKTKAVRTRFINQFTVPIKRDLNKEGIPYTIKGRTKSIYSIYNKMKKKNIPFEEVYDVFAIRIIADAPVEQEKAVCWKIYSIVTDHYTPNPDRLRDWISVPKSTGYESLHTTVMSPSGKWVEVQIRSKRMDEIAEKGIAAHWKYKEGSQENTIDQWLAKVRELLENPEQNTLEFLDDFKLNFFSDEIYVFTPKGEVRTLPKGATALDFAFDIHTKIGEHCMGAKVNHKLVPLSHELRSGDQVEIITSSKQKPKEDWLNFVVTAKAKSKIKSALKEEKRRIAEQGKEILLRKLKANKINADTNNLHKLAHYYKQATVLDLYYKIGKGQIDLKSLKRFKVENGNIKTTVKRNTPKIEEIVSKVRGSKTDLVIGDDVKDLKYRLAKCCNPIAGDDVFGFISTDGEITIHRVNCPNAINLMSKYAYRVVKAKWRTHENISFLAGIKITGIDELGLVNNITKIISEQMHVNMRSITFDTDDGIFEGKIILYVYDTEHLYELIEKLKKVKGVLQVERMDNQ